MQMLEERKIFRSDVSLFCWSLQTAAAGDGVLQAALLIC